MGHAACASAPASIRLAVASLSNVVGIPKATAAVSSNGWYSATINHVLRPRDRGCSWRSKERDQIGNFAWLGRTSDWDTAKRVHQRLASTFIVSPLASGQFFDQANRGFGLN